MLIQDYVVRFEDLTLGYDMREHHFQTKKYLFQI